MRHTAARLALVLAVAVVARLAVLPLSTQRNMDPDSAHLMNVARCFERGQGFSNPAAWPAWMKPARLPMPETFKEPAYPWTIARLAGPMGGEFPAGVLIAFLAGLVLPLVTHALARNLGCGVAESTLAALLVAVNPVSTGMSVRVSVDALFPPLLMSAFALATWRRDVAAARPWWADAATGAVLGAAFMTRGQTLAALPAIALLVPHRPAGRAVRGALVIAAAAAIAAAPFVLRNLRLFGVPFHSDVGAFGLWPYMDRLMFEHGLERPPAPIPWALAHPAPVLAHWVSSLVRFLAFVLPGDVLGNPVWVPACAVGGVLMLAAWRRFAGLLLYLVCTLGFVFAVIWDSRYFSSIVPIWALITALGAMWIARPLAGLRIAGPVRGVHLLVATCAVVAAVQVADLRRDFGRMPALEAEAARHLGPFLHAHLAPGESVMVMNTALFSWFADRPSVHFVIADEPRFMEVVRRLRVRWAALPTSVLPRLAERSPGGRLPAALEPVSVDPARDITLFRVRDRIP